LWLFIDIGHGVVNLLDWFKFFRQDLGLSTNPAGWELNIIAFALGTFSPECTDHILNDYIGCYLPQTSLCNMQPWDICQTRYFYFWATNVGEKMKSTSCIFSKHREYAFEPSIAYFYPSPHPEANTVDGWVRNSPDDEFSTWANMHDGPGDSHADMAPYIRIVIVSKGVENEWDILYRGILLFDTSTLGPDVNILSARLRVKTESRKSVEEWGAARLAVVSSLPALNTALRDTDYATLGTLRLSNIIGWAHFLPLSTNYF
ncbi:unnamed protein product, partial [marine sediment metagenome]